MKVKNKTVKKIVTCGNKGIEMGFVDFSIKHDIKITGMTYKNNSSFVNFLKLKETNYIKDAVYNNVENSDFSIIITPLCNYCFNTINICRELEKPYIVIDPSISDIYKIKTKILKLKKQKITINISSSNYPYNTGFDWFKKTYRYSKYPLNPYTRGSRLARNLFELDE